MSRVLDHLHALNYTQEFCQAQGQTPLSPYGLAFKSGPPGSQFRLFSSLAMWLIGVISGSPGEVDPFADPHVIASSVVAGAQAAGVSPPPASKLVEGVGVEVLGVLEGLAEKALEGAGFAYGEVELGGEEGAEEAVVDDMEVRDDDVSADSDDEVGYLEARREGGGEGEGDGREEEAAAWRAEVARLGPMLKSGRGEADPNEWRFHVERMKKGRAKVVAAMEPTGRSLTRLAGDVNALLEKISSREAYINDQLAGLLDEYGEVNGRAKEVAERYKHASEEVANLTAQLRDLTAELDEIRNRVDSQAGAINDGSPVVTIKETLASVDAEVKAMEVRIGVVQALLLRHQVKARAETAILRDDQNRTK